MTAARSKFDKTTKFLHFQCHGAGACVPLLIIAAIVFLQQGNFLPVFTPSSKEGQRRPKYDNNSAQANEALNDNRKWLDREWRKLHRQDAKYSSREFMDYALECIETYPERSTEMFSSLRKMQDLNPNSKSFGNFAWYSNQDAPDDLNAGEFVMQHALIIWLKYRDKLPPDAAKLLRTLMESAIPGIERHKVDITYTNIFVMRCWNKIGLGEALQQPALAEEGYKDFEKWLAFTQQNGIHEYLSPTYNGTDLDSLALIRKFAIKEDAKLSARRMLTFLWRDLAANWFEPDKRLAGPHSRDYDYLTGHGYLDRHLADAGWISKSGTEEHPLEREAERWVPPETIAKEFKLPRMVLQRFGDQPGEYASDYLTKTYAMGCAGSCYGPEDKTLTINFAGGPKQVMVNYFLDGRGDPYGQHKEMMGKSGHEKAHHLVPFVASAQQANRLLFVSSFNASRDLKKKEKPPEVLNSQLDLPDDLQVWSGNERLDQVESGQAVLDVAKPVFLRYGNVVAAIDFIVATDCTGNKARLFYVKDGAEFHAARITVVHADRPVQGTAIFVLAIEMHEESDDRQFEELRMNHTSGRVQVKVDGGVMHLVSHENQGTPELDLTCDIDRHERMQVGIQPTSALNVNGEPVAY